MAAAAAVVAAAAVPTQAQAQARTPVPVPAFVCVPAQVPAPSNALGLGLGRGAEGDESGSIRHGAGARVRAVRVSQLWNPATHRDPPEGACVPDFVLRTCHSVGLRLGEQRDEALQRGLRTLLLIVGNMWSTAPFYAVATRQECFQAMLGSLIALHVDPARMRAVRRWRAARRAFWLRLPLADRRVLAHLHGMQPIECAAPLVSRAWHALCAMNCEPAAFLLCVMVFARLCATGLLLVHRRDGGGVACSNVHVLLVVATVVSACISDDGGPDLPACRGVWRCSPGYIADVVRVALRAVDYRVAPTTSARVECAHLMWAALTSCSASELGAFV